MKEEYPKELYDGTREEYIFNIRRMRNQKKRRGCFFRFIVLLLIILGLIHLFWDFIKSLF